MLPFRSFRALRPVVPAQQWLLALQFSSGQSSSWPNRMQNQSQQNQSQSKASTATYGNDSNMGGVYQQRQQAQKPAGQQPMSYQESMNAPSSTFPLNAHDMSRTQDSNQAVADQQKNWPQKNDGDGWAQTEMKYNSSSRNPADFSQKMQENAKREQQQQGSSWKDSSSKPSESFGGYGGYSSNSPSSSGSDTSSVRDSSLNSKDSSATRDGARIGSSSMRDRNEGSSSSMRDRNESSNSNTNSNSNSRDRSKSSTDEQESKHESFSASEVPKKRWW